MRLVAGVLEAFDEACWPFADTVVVAAMVERVALAEQAGHDKLCRLGVCDHLSGEAQTR